MTIVATGTSETFQESRRIWSGREWSITQKIDNQVVSFLDLILYQWQLFIRGDRLFYEVFIDSSDDRDREPPQEWNIPVSAFAAVQIEPMSKFDPAWRLPWGVHIVGAAKERFVGDELSVTARDFASTPAPIIDKKPFFCRQKDAAKKSPASFIPEEIRAFSWGVNRDQTAQLYIVTFIFTKDGKRLVLSKRWAGTANPRSYPAMDEALAHQNAINRALVEAKRAKSTSRLRAIEDQEY